MLETPFEQNGKRCKNQANIVKGTNIFYTAYVYIFGILDASKTINFVLVQSVTRNTKPNAVLLLGNQAEKDIGLQWCGPHPKQHVELPPTKKK